MNGTAQDKFQLDKHTGWITQTKQTNERYGELNGRTYSRADPDSTG